MKKPVTKCCRECAKPLEPGMRREAAFCSVPCRAAWQNRSKLRGADVYHLFMAMRYRRDEAEDLKVWSEMCRLAEGWNAEDVEAGRQSFEEPKITIARLADKGAIPRARPYRT